MKKLRLKTEKELSPYFDDIQRIIYICNDRGYEIEYEVAQTAWEKYSDSMCAGWLRLDESDDHVFGNIRPYLVEED